MVEKIKALFRNTFLYQALHKMHRKRIMAQEAKNYPTKRRQIMDTYSETLRYLNVGDGRFARPHWRLLDYAGEDSNYKYKESLIDYNVNLLNIAPWPIDDATFDVVYSSHCLEHLTMSAIENSFKEIFRILKPKGVFRLTVPNIDPAYEAYAKNDLAWFEQNGNPADKRNINTRFLGYFSSKKMENIGESVFRQDFEQLSKTEFLNKYIEEEIDLTTHRFENHVSWINHELVQALGQKMGFSQIKPSSRGQSVVEELRNPVFDHKSGKGNLYVDLIK